MAKSSQSLEIEIRDSFRILMCGSRPEYTDAKKRIGKLWHSNRKEFRRHASIALEYLPRFDEIKTVENQAAFCSGLSIFYLILGDDHFEILKNFTLKALQHPHGHVRESIRKTADWLCYSLSERADTLVYPEGKKLSEQQKVAQAEARSQYLDLVKEIEAIIDQLDPDQNNFEYIGEMKPSVNKSLQQFWARLTETPVYKRLSEQRLPSPMEIYLERKRIETEITAMLKSTKSDYSLHDVCDAIFREEDNDDMMRIIAMFDRGGGTEELSNILELVTDAWNYLPHKALDGKSPAEKFLEIQNEI